VTEYHIVDNLLPEQDFFTLKELMEGSDLPWFYISHVADESDVSDSYFNHTFYANGIPNSNNYSSVVPLLNQIECKAIIRVRANLYPSKQEIIEHAQHADFPFDHKAMILYINTNNGFTCLKDGTKIESVANRALFFNGGELHNSTTCTDSPCRINLSINYF
jgi:hypothetical protein